MAIKLCLLGNNGSTHIQKWVHALSLFPGVELHVVTFNMGIKYPEATYHYLKKYSGTKIDYLLNIPLFRKFVREIKPDIVHAHYSTSYGFMAACSGFHPLVITGWGADVFDSPKSFFMKRMLLYSLKQADALTVLSEITLREINKYTNYPVSRVPFGVDTEIFTVVKQKPVGNAFRIGTIRTLSPKYGIEFIIRAIALLSGKYPDLKLEIVGDGPQKEFLMNLCRELNIEHCVIFHGYVNQHSEFQKYHSLLSGFDVFVIPSVIDSETFGVAAVEASSCGIPVIASRVGGLPEVVLDGETGILVEPGNPKEIAEAIEMLIKNPGLREQMGKNGRMFVERNYNWSANVEQMINVYKSVLDK